MAHKMSPVVYADARFCGGPQFLHVGIWFNGKSELDELVKALTDLRDTAGDDFDHVHLQRDGLSKNSPAGDAEVIFYRPGHKPDNLNSEMAVDAEQWISVARKAAIE